ncbi:hypothetical protein [Streptomyces sp. NPDC020607]|uniref:type I-G CRISPR-associated protein, Cas3-extension family n=1 Tax=Streptomyces sp. NPDC020607 TaxID=3365082 RepID=UPI0037BB12A8
MHQLELPALLSDSPLGFLAALGILELTEPQLAQPPRLSWQGPAAPAVLHTHEPLHHAQLAELLQAQLPEHPAKEPLDIAPGILSLPKEKNAPNDALRMPIGLALQRLGEHTRAEREIGSSGAPAGSRPSSTNSASPPKTPPTERDNGKPPTTPGSPPPHRSSPPVAR